MVTLEAVTPGEFKSGGGGLVIRVGRHTTPFGTALLAVTDRGIVALNFVDDHGWDAALAALRSRWPGATLVRDDAATAAASIFAETPPQTPLHLLVKGTNFQVKVWEALLRIPAGAVATYGDVAAAIDQPRAVRAVGSAVGANAIAYLIPCHRVIRQGGAISDYAWGTTRKRALLGWEAALLDKDAARA
jgi:AraC family transcriptional regulator of adaptative response/methylated-DNA-[protein]-cysteine methyltransferase